MVWTQAGAEPDMDAFIASRARGIAAILGTNTGTVQETDAFVIGRTRGIATSWAQASPEPERMPLALTVYQNAVTNTGATPT